MSETFTRPIRLAVGILAGGQGMRLGGIDKGWVGRDGVAQIERVLAAVHRNLVLVPADRVVAAPRVLVSANRSFDRYAALGVEVVPDRWPGFPGPMAGLASLAGSSLLRTQGSGVSSASWLLTLPVDVQHVPDDLLAQLLDEADACVAQQADATSIQHDASIHADQPLAPIVAGDIERDQPLFALYSPSHLVALIDAFAAGERSIAHWQRMHGARIRHFPALRFGNLNSPADLHAR